MSGFVYFVTGCCRCPYKDSDRDGVDYCAASDGYEEARVNLVHENSNGITPSCPMHDECREEEIDALCERLNR